MHHTYFQGYLKSSNYSYYKRLGLELQLSLNMADQGTAVHTRARAAGPVRR